MCCTCTTRLEHGRCSQTVQGDVGASSYIRVQNRYFNRNAAGKGHNLRAFIVSPRGRRCRLRRLIHSTSGVVSRGMWSYFLPMLEQIIVTETVPLPSSYARCCFTGYTVRSVTKFMIAE